MSDELPLVGCALMTESLREMRAFVLAEQRPLELQDAVQPDFLDSDWPSHAAEIKSLLDGFHGGLTIHGPFKGFNLICEDGSIAAVIIRRIRQALEFGAEIGASQMVLHSPFHFFGGPWIPHMPGRGLDRDIEVVQRVLEQPLREAGQAGITIVLENIDDLNPRAIDTLVETIGSPHLQRSLDTGHAHLTQRRGGPTPDGWVRATGSLLHHVHLADNDTEQDRHWAPGKGSINWHAFWRAIATLEHTPRLILELKRADAIQPAIRWLQENGYCR